MKSKSRWWPRARRKRWAVLVAAVLLGLLSLIPLRLVVVMQQYPTAQALLVLEGNPDRVRFSAQFATTEPKLPIVVSGNPNGLDRNQRIFQQAQIPARQVHYDFCATDTVSNFTCTVDWFGDRNIHNVYLITSDYHMQRSQAIAFWVYGSRGIIVTPIEVPSTGHDPESPLETLRDVLRSIVWIFTGWSSANLNPEVWH